MRQERSDIKMTVLKIVDRRRHDNKIRSVGIHNLLDLIIQPERSARFLLVRPDRVNRIGVDFKHDVSSTGRIPKGHPKRSRTPATDHHSRGTKARRTGSSTGRMLKDHKALGPVSSWAHRSDHPAFPRLRPLRLNWDAP